MYLKRKIDEYLLEWKKNEERLPLIIKGARQVGKSTIVKHEFPEFNRASFDDRLTRLQAREEPKLFFINNPCPLFIDEVQKEGSILENVKLTVDETDERGLFIL